MHELEVIVITLMLVQACVIPGVFLVLRGMALMSDAISHAALLGIVLAFFVVGTLDSVWLIVAAASTGLVTVILTEGLVATQRVKKDAAIGLVFPVFFSLGVLLISRYLGSVHIDSDCILFGELAFAPFERMILMGIDLGPTALWVLGSICGVNLGYCSLFFKELAVSTFDTGFAYSLGVRPVAMHYGLMIITSITAVGAFESVGSILVVALMITPAATAILLATRLQHVLTVASLAGSLAVVIGYWVAYYWDVSIAGSIVMMSGVLFVLALIAAPRSGLLIRAIRFKQQRIQFASTLLLVQLLEHEGTVNENTENTVDHLCCHMKWTPYFAKKVVAYSVQKATVIRKKQTLFLTSFGREAARQYEQLG